MTRMLMTCLILLCATPAFALTATWNRNAEEDMKEYHMYMCEGKNCTIQKVPSMIVGTIPQPAANVQPTWPIPNGKVGAISVTAIDQSGNESGLSNVVFFDSTPPAQPTGLATK